MSDELQNDKRKHLTLNERAKLDALSYQKEYDKLTEKEKREHDKREHDKQFEEIISHFSKKK